MDATTQSKLDEIFAVVLDLPPEADLHAVTKDSVSTWDSLASLSMVAALESELGLVLESEHRDRFSSYESVRDLIEELTA